MIAIILYVREDVILGLIVLFIFVIMPIFLIWLIATIVKNPGTKKIKKHIEETSPIVQTKEDLPPILKEIEPVYIPEEEFPVSIGYYENDNIITLKIDYEPSEVDGKRILVKKISKNYSFVNIGDDLVKIEIVDDKKNVLSHSIIKSKFKGIYVLLKQQMFYFETRFAKIYNVDLASENFTLDEILEIVQAIEKRFEQRNEERRILKESECEKEAIKQKLIAKQKKRDLEKIAAQELMDEGVLFPEANKRPPIPKEVVDAVWNRDGGRCVYCDSTDNLHLDHIIPFSKGGATNVENLQLLCQKCNLEKSNKIG